MEHKLRLKRFEEEKREEARRGRLEQERVARERELAKREEEERQRLRYGPKKVQRTDSKGYPLSSAGVRRTRASDDSDDEGAMALTREEKRKRRVEAEMRQRVSTPRRATQSSGYTKAGRRLPGGAVDIMTTSMALADSNSSLSVRQRLAAAPAMLIKLNVNKRDTRTIDEIQRDLEKAKAAKVLQGDDAREFSDWFGKGKVAAKKTASPTDSTSTSRANTPAGSQIAASKLASGSASPAAKTPSNSRPSAPSATSKSAPPPPPPLRPTALKATPGKSTSFGQKSSPAFFKATPSSSKLATSASKPNPKKHTRSSSSEIDLPEPSAKRRATSAGPRSNDISQEIWKLFGKDRSQYVRQDIVSDDEDMEADAQALEREEKRSMRMAKREDELALEEERRHEEEKRRRRKEKETREKRAW